MIGLNYLIELVFVGKLRNWFRKKYLDLFVRLVKKVIVLKIFILFLKSMIVNVLKVSDVFSSLICVVLLLIFYCLIFFLKLMVVGYVFYSW